MSASEILAGIKGLANYNNEADLIFMYDGVQLIHTYSSIILGVLIVIIMVATPFVVALELMYINFPNLRSSVNEFIDNRKDKAVAKSLTLFLRDATRAVKEADTLNTGKSANMTYLIIKLKTILTMVVILAIILGGLPIILNFLVSTIVTIANSIG